MVAEHIMEILRKTVKPLPAIGENRFRRTKSLIWFQIPSKIKRVNPHLQTNIVKLIQLCIGKKIAAVYQRKTIGGTGMFGGFWRYDGHEWILLMTRRTTTAFYGVDAMPYGLALYLPFTCMGAI